MLAQCMSILLEHRGAVSNSDFLTQALVLSFNLTFTLSRKASLKIKRNKPTVRRYKVAVFLDKN